MTATPQWRRSYLKTYSVDVNSSRTPEEGAHSPSLPNRLIIIIDELLICWSDGLARQMGAAVKKNADETEAAADAETSD
jgi:hypothetical protein